MARKNRLNNRMLRNMRKEPEYQAVITDLTLLGIITEEQAHKVLGYDVPDYLSLGAASGVVSKSTSTSTSATTPTSTSATTPATTENTTVDGTEGTEQ